MIAIKNLTKDFIDELGNKTILLRNISLTIPSDKITSIIAPAGSGKSTLMKIISGLESKTEGEVISSSDKKIIFIPSRPSSYPWLNVLENVKLGLLKCDDSEIKTFINIVGLEGYETFHPNNMSFGFRFRIALARSLALKPEAILLDEPFNQMDLQTKKEILFLIRNIKSTQKTTILLATTNITEALFFSNKIYLMKKNPGEIISEIEVDLQAVPNELIFGLDKFIQLRNQIESSFKKIESQQLFNISI